MRLFGTIYGAFIGAIPGIVVLTLADGDSTLTVVGSLLLFLGAFGGGYLSFRRGRWLNLQGMIGGAIGLLVGLLGFVIGFDADVVIYLILGAFLVGLFVGLGVGGPK